MIQNLHLRGVLHKTPCGCLDNGLRLLHPFMPFVTEELWQRLPSPKDSTRKKSIMICEYPSIVECWTNERVEYEMGMVESALKSFRSLRSEMPANERHERRSAFARCRTDEDAEIMKSHELEISTLATLSSLKVLHEEDAPPGGCSVSIVNENLSVYLKLRGNLNVEAEREKLKKKTEEIQKELDVLNKRTSASGYQKKAQDHIREENQAKLDTLVQQLSLCEDATQRLERDIAAEASGNETH